VEALRSKNPSKARSGVLFRNWGIRSPRQFSPRAPWVPDTTVFAVGGIQDGIQVAKLVALGADLCGMARQLLAPAVESAEAAVAELRQHLQDVRIAMFCSGRPQRRRPAARRPAGPSSVSRTEAPGTNARRDFGEAPNTRRRAEWKSWYSNV
jgi:hypothetical protein